MKRNSQRGVALVITLIMLAMVTLMALLFLGISRRERASVTVAANMTDAKLAADTAQYRAVAEMVARITAQTNLFAYDFLVSTNFNNPNGIPPGNATLANVSYYSAVNRQLLSGTDLNQMLTNQLYDPRPPVFVPTPFGTNDFRFYLDLNRNGRFDTNGFQPVLDANGVPLQGVTNFFTGDPEWIGILQYPDVPYGPTNHYIARFAFVVVPAGKTLDINYIHNIARSLNSSGDQTGFIRNQGVGPWEINLAAFLRELNTNVWNAPGAYSYNPPPTPKQPPQTGRGVGGFAFGDAFGILSYRYRQNGGTWLSPVSANRAFGSLANIFRTDQINEYSDGPIMTGINPPVETGAGVSSDDPSLLWSGANSTNGYTSVQELFDPTKTSVPFASRLLTAINGKGTYNQNTFYRLMSQLGTDSLPANRGKINLNWDNVDANGRINPNLTTNFVPWTPIRFFTNAADLMLRSESGRVLASLGLSNSALPTLSVTNIPIYPTNFYNAGVHRLLQVAANIYDASTNRLDRRLAAGTNNMDYYAPSVFRPLFGVRTVNGTNNIFISGYEEVTNVNQVLSPAVKWVDLSLPGASQYPDGSYGRDAVASDPRANVYGVPLVIGAKKGLPNFNEFLLDTDAFVTRRVQAFRPNVTTTNVIYQQSWQFAVTNTLGAEAWNSYTQPFPVAVTMYVTNRASMMITNEFVGRPVTNEISLTTVVTNLPAGTWGGWNPNVEKGPSFQVPLNRTVATLPEESVRSTFPFIAAAGTNKLSFDPLNDFRLPGLKLYVTNRLQYALVATSSTGIPVLLDFVNLDGMVSTLDFMRNLVGNTDTTGTNPGEGTNRFGMFWLTNRVGNSTAFTVPTAGITNQIYASLTYGFLSDGLDGEWANYSHDANAGNNVSNSIYGFRKFLGLEGMQNLPADHYHQVPFTPTRQLHQELAWQANDPLVHYTLQDLADRDYVNPDVVETLKPHQTPRMKFSSIGDLNARFWPWGGNPRKSAPASKTAIPQYDLSIMDPLITKSDDWVFPTNQFPNIGWLGRVHRGTPWQTIYLKSTSTNIGVQTWGKWAGGTLPQLTWATFPTNDWHLPSLFTTAINDNAARGLLSVNQTNSAAWSAVLSGVSVLTNTAANPQQIGASYSSLFVQPASPQLYNILTNINATRLQMPNQVFPDLGSVFASPALTVASPYLNVASDNQKNYGIPDEVYERIPQQIMSLLKDDEPYVMIYAYGQSLRPADNSVVLAPGPYRNLVTNYEITGEVVTKTGVRIEELPRQQLTDPRRYRAVVESYAVLPSD